MLPLPLLLGSGWAAGESAFPVRTHEPVLRWCVPLSCPPLEAVGASMASRWHTSIYLRILTDGLVKAAEGSQTRAWRKLFVEAWDLLLPVEIRKIMLDPELSAGLLDESLDGSPARKRLV